MDTASSANKPALQLGDIYYLLFRHKWKILICTLAGLIGAAVYQRTSAPLASSTAKLYIRYVTESQGITPTGEEELRTRTPGQRGDTTLASEVAIITSLNVARQVANTIGAEKILKAYGGGQDLNQAASLVRSGLTVEIPKASAVVNVTFTHRDLGIVQQVLTEIINQYLKQHLEIHRGTGMVDAFLTKQTDELRARLSQTEEELRLAKAKAGVISPEVAKNYFAETTARIKQDILNTQAFLAEHYAILEQLRKTTGTEPLNNETPAPKTPPEVVQSHKDIVSQIEVLRRREQELLVQYTPESTQVIGIRASLATAYGQKGRLEAEYPELATPGQQAGPVPGVDRAAQLQNRISDELSLLAANEAKTKALQKQLEQITYEALAFDQNESRIVELQRKRQIDEKNYLEYSASLAKARTSEALSSDQISNISQIQTPTPAYRDWTLIKKIAAGIAGGGLLLGLAWAVLVEFFVDRSLRRPGDVEQALKLPLFLSVPSLPKSKILPPPLKNEASVKLLKGSDADGAAPVEPIIPYEGSSALNPYFETLRDRLIAYFESINLRHRPKLIAVTGLGRESGVSTTAAGLARSLSETGEGNVLLVDMTQKEGKGAAMPFFQGKAMPDLDHLLESADPIKGENKLFVASEGTGSEALSRQLPQRFSQLVPKLKTSNFDYIIFDMPPVSQISITPRLASSMDMVMMVVESEKTDKDMARRAAALLNKANTNVGVILNKTKAYVPGSLLKDRDFFLDA